jgi:hypothetical protein
VLAKNLKGFNYGKKKDIGDILSTEEQEDTGILPSPYKTCWLVGWG